jgi:hypothetical protein
MSSIRSSRFVCLAVLILAIAGSALAGGGKAAPKISTPTISCGGSTLLTDSTTQASLNLTVTAGATGLPAGFSVQWMTATDFAAYGGWPKDSECLTSVCAPTFCKASFSGNASGFYYNIPPGGSVTVTLGEELTENGASTSCPGALLCGTTYVFRAFGHATNSQQRSDFSADTSCSTAPCGHDGGCTYTQGYWKTHGIDPFGQNSDQWPADVQANGLALGNVSYTELQLLQILQMSSGGNGLVTLAHQLIATKLNIANGSDPTAIAATVAAADALIGNNVVGVNSLSPGSVSSLVQALTNYNEGHIGPGHCE